MQLRIAVIDPSEKRRASALLQGGCGQLDQPVTGISFTLPVQQLVALAPQPKEPEA
jgi:hypothetical protein